MEPFVCIEMLPADYGDALYINYGEGFATPSAH
jgi:hypothetical protein